MRSVDPLTSIDSILISLQPSFKFQYSHSSDFISITIMEKYEDDLMKKIKDGCNEYGVNIESLKIEGKDGIITIYDGKPTRTKEIIIRKKFSFLKFFD